MTVTELKNSYYKMLKNEPNELEVAYRSDPYSTTINITNAGASKSWIGLLILGILLLYIGIGLIFIIVALKKRSKMHLSPEDEEFLSKFKGNSKINKDECFLAYCERVNMKKLELGFEALIDHINKKTYEMLFYKELDSKTGFLFRTTDLKKAKIIFNDGKSFYLYFLVDNVSDFEVTVEKENIVTFKTENDIKIISNYTGGLLGAAVGAGLGYLTGESILGSAALGSTMGRGAEVKQATVTKTLLFLDNGTQFYFDGSAAYTYFNAYFNKVEKTLQLS